MLCNLSLMSAQNSSYTSSGIASSPSLPRRVEIAEIRQLATAFFVSGSSFPHSLLLAILSAINTAFISTSTLCMPVTCSWRTCTSCSKIAIFFSPNRSPRLSVIKRIVRQEKTSVNHSRPRGQGYQSEKRRTYWIGLAQARSGEQRAQQVANQLQYYDSYHRGKIEHAGSGDNTAQRPQYRLGDLNQNNNQTIGRIG